MHTWKNIVTLYEWYKVVTVLNIMTGGGKDTVAESCFHLPPTPNPPSSDNLIVWAGQYHNKLPGPTCFAALQACPSLVGGEERRQRRCRRQRPAAPTIAASPCSSSSRLYSTTMSRKACRPIHRFSLLVLFRL